MWKEVIICFIIVILILLGNFLMQNYTVKSVETLSNDLDVLREEILDQQDKEEVSKDTKETITKLKDNWKEKYEKLAYFIEHNELEKVENNFTGVESFVEMKEYAEAVNELDKSKFILQHIKEKYEFKLENIF